jgi:transcriptional regulator with XRE-family HTH domain
MKKTKIGQLLIRLMAEKKIRVAELARLVGLPQPTVHRIATGVCEHPHISSLAPIADYFGITVEQLKGHELIPWLDRATKVPLLSGDEVLKWPANKNKLTPNELVLTDANVGLNGYAFKVNDAAMDPVFPPEMILIADPERQPKDRSYVIAKLANIDQPVFRQLLIDARDRYLKALSPDLELHKTTRLTQHDKILSVIVQAKRDCEF